MLLPILILILVKFKYPGQCLKTSSLSPSILSWFPAQYHEFGLPQTAPHRWGHGMFKAKSTQLASIKTVKLCFQLTQDWKKVKKSSPKTCQPKVGPLMAIYQLTMDWEKADYWPTVKFLGTFFFTFTEHWN